MGTKNRFTGLDPYAAQIIRHKARKLIGRAGFGEDDREDIEQELALDLLRRMPKYDCRRAQRSTFIARVVEHKIATLVQAQKAGMRDYRRRGGSLNEIVEAADGETDERINAVDPEACLHCAGRYPLPAVERQHLTLDIDRVLAELPADLRHLAEQLKTWSVADISRRSGIPRGTLYESIRRLRARFECAGVRLGEKDPTDRGRRR